MVKQSQKIKNKARKKFFKVWDMVSIKIDRVDKTSLHPNTLLGKTLEFENDYASVAREFGKIQAFVML